MHDSWANIYLLYLYNDVFYINITFLHPCLKKIKAFKDASFTPDHLVSINLRTKSMIMENIKSVQLVTFWLVPYRVLTFSGSEV